MASLTIREEIWQLAELRVLRAPPRSNKAQASRVSGLPCLRMGFQDGKARTSSLHRSSEYKVSDSSAYNVLRSAKNSPHTPRRNASLCPLEVDSNIKQTLIRG